MAIRLHDWQGVVIGTPCLVCGEFVSLSAEEADRLDEKSFGWAKLCAAVQDCMTFARQASEASAYHAGKDWMP